MQSAVQARVFQWQLIHFFRILFGLHLVYSGAAYVFFGWVPSAFSDPASPVGQFMVALDSVGLYPLVKHVELVLGVLLLANLFVPLAAVMELPITIIIAYLNIFVEGQHAARHFYTGAQELVINGVVLLGYGAYYRTMLGMRSRPQWLWQPLDLRPPALAAGARPFRAGAPMMWASFLVIMAVVLAASWFMGSADRRLPPRDWLPPLLAFAAMLVTYQFARAGRVQAD